MNGSVTQPRADHLQGLTLIKTDVGKKAICSEWMVPLEEITDPGAKPLL